MAQAARGRLRSSAWLSKDEENGVVLAAQLDQVLVELRELILNGELKPGERLAEIPLAERLAVSRTPVRHALTLLEAEGLLEPTATRGFVVRRFGYQDIADAIDVRGVLEGLAARLVAQHGVTRRLQNILQECVEEGDRLIAEGADQSEIHTQFAQVNSRFHEAIIEEAGNKALSNAISMNDKLPFAAAASVAWDNSDRQPHRTLMTAQIEHSLIYEALIAGEGGRAEALMKEHANVAKDNVRALATDADGAVRGSTPLSILRAS